MKSFERDVMSKIRRYELIREDETPVDITSIKLLWLLGFGDCCAIFAVLVEVAMPKVFTRIVARFL